MSGRLQPRPTRRSARRRAGLQSQVHQNRLDDQLLEDRSDDLQRTAAVRAVLEVEFESEALEKTNLSSSCVVAKTRLSSRAQLSRTGLWCAQSASRVSGGAAWAGATGPCSTNCARSLALGASTLGEPAC